MNVRTLDAYVLTGIVLIAVGHPVEGCICLGIATLIWKFL
jgi:hypothetical protein